MTQRTNVTGGVPRAPRIDRTIKVTCMLEDEGVFPATVRNLSLSGLLCEGLEPVEKGAKVKVILSNEDPTGAPQPVLITVQVTGEVAWCQESGSRPRLYQFGLRFATSTNRDTERLVRFFLEEFDVSLQDWAQRRKHYRVVPLMRCRYKGADGVTHQALLRDVSLTGLGLLTNEKVEVGSRIEVSCFLDQDELLECEGDVVRCDAFGESYDVGTVLRPLNPLQRERLVRTISQIFHDQRSLT